MKTFILSGKMTFNAENLNDAFVKLSEHFGKLANDEDSELCLVDTEINLHAYENYT